MHFKELPPASPRMLWGDGGRGEKGREPWPGWRGNGAEGEGSRAGGRKRWESAEAEPAVCPGG